MPAATSNDPRVRMFGAWVKRTLNEARERGMTIDDIEAAIRATDPQAKVGRSTIYRWRRAEIPNPQRQQVQAFCDGLGIPRHVPSQILGWDGAPPSASPDPMVDPDLRAVAQILMDPNVPAEEKTIIRATLRHLARRR